MRRLFVGLRTLACIGAAAAAGCASSGTAPKAAPERPSCESGTLGLEAAPLSRSVRKKLALPDDAAGAVVVEVLPGGPAAAAGIRLGDVVSEIGPAAIRSDCDFDQAAHVRTCEPVTVVVRRGGASVSAVVVPVEAETFHEKGCRDGSPTACFRHAFTLWARNRGGDRERAADIYQAACRAGSAGACSHEGRNLLDRPDLASDAVPVLQKSCDLGSGSGCTSLAFLYATGKIVRRDDHRATPLYVRACDLGDAHGCYNAGLMSDDGRGVPRDTARAVARYREACELGSSTACTNLGFHYEHGNGVEKNASRAFALYERGCRATSCQASNLGGCLNAGRARRDGIGVEKDAAKAAEVFREACDRKPDPDDPGSAENRSRGCSLLGGLYLAGDGVETDYAKGRELSETGCEQGDAFGCFNAAAVYSAGSGVPADPSRAAAFLEKACQAGDGEGCFDLGVASEKGKGVARDRKRAAELYRKACELGFKSACGRKGR
ncbi:MAG: PDZ domain-containing protein [Acidobacteriota bacterium]